MLGLLCNAPNLDEDPFEQQFKSPGDVGRKKKAQKRRFSLTLPTTPRSTRQLQSKISKESISSPTAFRHEFHLGLDITHGIRTLSRDTWDEDRWRREFNERVEVFSERPFSQSQRPLQPWEEPSTPPPIPHVLRKRDSNATLVKRKPVPVLLPEEILAAETTLSARPTSPLVFALMPDPLPTNTLAPALIVPTTQETSQEIHTLTEEPEQMDGISLNGQNAESQDCVANEATTEDNLPILDHADTDGSSSGHSSPGPSTPPELSDEDSVDGQSMKVVEDFIPDPDIHETPEPHQNQESVPVPKRFGILVENF